MNCSKQYYEGIGFLLVKNPPATEVETNREGLKKRENPRYSDGSQLNPNSQLNPKMTMKEWIFDVGFLVVCPKAVLTKIFRRVSIESKFNYSFVLSVGVLNIGYGTIY
jgi:hypothetical protein